MSINIPINGSFTFTPIIDTYIKTAGGSPPPPIVGNGVSKPINFNNKIIIWESDVPPFITGKTLTQLYALNISPITYSLNGIFGIEAGSKGGTEEEGIPTINVSLLASNRKPVIPSFDIETLVQGDFSDVDCGPGDGPNGTGPPCIPFCINDVSPCPKSLQILTPAILSSIKILQLIPWNPCPIGACYNRDASGVTFSITINISLVITCGGDNLNSGFCKAYCYKSGSVPKENFNVCLQPYISYCFASDNLIGKVDGTGSPVGPCYGFFDEFINSKTGPGINITINTKLSEYCKKYKGINDLITNGNSTDQDLCGCNLNPTQYTNLENSIFAAFPNYANVTGISSPCLLPQCISSPLIHSKDPCPLPACVVITEINNEGSIVGNINTTGNAKCANITGNGGNPSSGGTDNETFWDKYKWIIIIGSIFILIMLIGVFVAIK